MNFREHYFTLIERFGLDAMYVPPKDKQYQLYDFYALSLINPNAFMDEEAQDYFKQAKETIVNHIYNDFMYAVYFALASELYHTNDASDFESFNYKNEKDRADLKKEVGLTDKEIDILGKLGSNIPSRKVRYNKLKKLLSPDEMANIAIKVFGKHKWWNSAYGGEAWANIAKGYKRLINAKTIGDKMVAIDHVYDLQHNSDTVFDKVQEYYKGGDLYWLKNALDDKAQIKEPHVYLDKTSPQLFRPLAYAFKQLYGKTLESFKTEKEEKIKQILGKYNVDINDPLVQEFLNAIQPLLAVYEKLDNYTKTEIISIIKIIKQKDYNQLSDDDTYDDLRDAIDTEETYDVIDYKTEVNIRKAISKFINRIENYKTKQFSNYLIKAGSELFDYIIKNSYNADKIMKTYDKFLKLAEKISTAYNIDLIQDIFQNIVENIENDKIKFKNEQQKEKAKKLVTTLLMDIEDWGL